MTFKSVRKTYLIFLQIQLYDVQGAFVNQQKYRLKSTENQFKKFKNANC